MTPAPHSLRRLYVLGGTGFARRLVDELEGAGYQVRLSVATSLGEEEVRREPAGGVQTGRLDAQALMGELERWQAAALIDATHPYAAEVSRLARGVATEAAVPLFRATRAPWTAASSSSEEKVRTGVRGSAALQGARVARKSRTPAPAATSRASRLTSVA